MRKSLVTLSAATLLAAAVTTSPVASAQGGTTTLGGSGLSSASPTSSGSSENPQCNAALSSVGIPLLVLAPVALAAQGLAPGFDGAIANIQAQIADANTSLQQGLGIHDPGTSAFVEQINGQLGTVSETVGPILGGAALIGGGLLASGYLVDQCTEDESAQY